MEWNQKGSSQNYFLALLLFLLAGGLLYFAFQKEEGHTRFSSKLPQSVSANSAEAEKVVNKYLKETNKAIELQQLQTKIQNQFVVPRVGEVITTNADVRKKKTITVTNSDVVGSNQNVYDTSSPAAKIQNELAEQQRLDDYDQKFREEYIRQFVENARRNGWKLSVDENGVIKSATPLNMEEKPRIFDGPSRLSNE